MQLVYLEKKIEGRRSENLYSYTDVDRSWEKVRRTRPSCSHSINVITILCKQKFNSRKASETPGEFVAFMTVLRFLLVNKNGVNHARPHMRFIDTMALLTGRFTKSSRGVKLKRADHPELDPLKHVH